MPIKNYTTKIDVFESLGEIQGALAKNGARKIMVDYDDNGRPCGITFGLQTAQGGNALSTSCQYAGRNRCFSTAEDQAGCGTGRAHCMAEYT